MVINDNMKERIYHTVGTAPKSKRNIVGTEAKPTHPAHRYMTVQFPDLVQTLQ